MVPDYDFVLSFAGEDRRHAEALADFATNEFGLSVFYDDYEQAKLWGTFLPERLLEIYRDRARACVVLISAAYKRKRWTTHEWRAAQERALLHPELEYILPVRLDDTKLDGLFEGIGYIDASSTSMRTVARLVYEKLADLSSHREIVRLADQQYREGLIDEALETAERATDREDLDLVRVKANCFGKKHMYEQSISCFEMIISRRPRDFTAHMHLGIYNFRLARLERAIKHYEIADEISPNHPTVVGDLMAARSKLERIKLEAGGSD